MRQKSSPPETPSERLVRDIRRATRKQYSAEEKIRIVLDGCAARSPSPNSAGAKASRRASTTAGRRNFWKPASAV